ncbi:triphosphoribosyl-dephospho-CoA synthase [Raoultella planticola]|uniref:triphosphoribosyl-dephospho-CoA synthase n=1 Tax=Raoultella planticola TaxID=575 RepID=UPI0010635FE5|nr:triphosphoribosyl-dephospho-CoA synthase [Raoultella planticola]EKW5592253.1 triphosphoribosyl-dephospho-CoA synthase [Raoultella planticola]MCS7489302.1 triphosphoribosyl-dephospho-CoA synthase [Raoultella planticola]MDC3906883.1 triphosphoribosyl-dephospho-CoA synthase [Raoultella planticola]TDV08952.1 triphosphoribosyl-dephospho-CoA synthase [Raoultella planticola]TDX39775.1 triphosphoribosyl-dephospho-CoA synthase [Raoultella planticola]
MKLLSQTHAGLQTEKLASIARDCLIDEARLSPKPGLVDSRGNGAHHDLSLDLMERSAHSLTPTFLQLAQHSWLRPADIALRETVGRLGREGERQMMAATDGVNTHRGAIWALGLLVSASAMLSVNASAQRIADTAALLARLPDSAAPKVFSKGLKATHRYRVPGAREEAQQGFPHVMKLALPQLLRSRAQGADENAARIDALMAVMTSLSDTCVLSRAGMAGLNAMQAGARAVLSAGGSATVQGSKALAELDTQLLTLNASPGGAADLLAATLFLDRVSQPASCSI